MAETLIERARRQAGITQGVLAARAGTSRPTLSAYEHGRKSPTLETATRIVGAAGFDLDLTERVSWTKVTGARGQVHHVPDRLLRLRPADAFVTFRAPMHLDWSRPDRLVDLADPRQRCRWYELVLREGSRADISRYVDGALLVDAWPDMVVPQVLRQPWEEVINRAIGRAS